MFMVQRGQVRASTCVHVPSCCSPIAHRLEEGHVQLQANERERVPHDLCHLLLWALHNLPHLHDAHILIC